MLWIKRKKRGYKIRIEDKLDILISLLSQSDTPFWFHSTIVQAASAVFEIVGTVVVFKVSNFKNMVQRNENELFNYLNYKSTKIYLFTGLPELFKNFEFLDFLSKSKTREHIVNSLFPILLDLEKFKILNELMYRNYMQLINEERKQAIGTLVSSLYYSYKEKSEYFSEIITTLSALFISIVSSAWYLLAPEFIQTHCLIALTNILSIGGFVLGLIMIGYIIISIMRKQ